MANNMKKDFQKIVKMYRDSMPDIDGWGMNWNTRKYEQIKVRPEYPKAMLTERQMANGTATINCGSKHNAGYQGVAEKLMDYEPFKIWCSSYGIKSATVEINGDEHYQVRVTF